MPYEWGGTTILQEGTALPDKRRVLGHPDQLVLTDLRDWLAAGDREEMRRVIRTLEREHGLPTDRRTGTFDRRAWIVWRFVVSKTTYAHDPGSHRLLDFWQFPAETIALGQGDCEDTSFLLASLLLAASISPFCVRVVFGWIKRCDERSSERHAWPIYKDERGTWRILESTLAAAELPDEWPSADDKARPGSRPYYKPDICLNNHHVWEVRELRSQFVSEFIRCYSLGRRRDN